MLFCRCAVLSPRCFVTELFFHLLSRLCTVLSLCSIVCMFFFFVTSVLSYILLSQFCLVDVLLATTVLLVCRFVAYCLVVVLFAAPLFSAARCLSCARLSHLFPNERAPPAAANRTRSLTSFSLHFFFLQRWPSSRILKSYAQCLRKRALAATASSKGGTTTRRAAPANPSSMVAAGAT